jgi:membrane associated rhomboid family serine protease
VFPYRDENPTERFPLVTVALILINVVVWIYFQGMGVSEPLMANALCNWGIIPGELTGGAVGAHVPVTQHFVCVVDPQPNWWTLITTQFLHGGWLHLIGNMLFLWVFGNNIEDSMGHFRFILFYLTCGVIAGLAQILATPSSPIPAVGASGAISGVLGAYLILFPRVRVWMIVPIFFFLWRVSLPAWVYLIYWAVLQLVAGFTERLTSVSGDYAGGVAVWAHVGGFAAGLALVHLFIHRDWVARKRRLAQIYQGERW